MADWIPAELNRILTQTQALADAYLVGGCVRDWLLEIPNKDYDIEVFGHSYESLAHALGRWGRTDLVGRSFGIIKLTLASGAVYDFSVPRRDTKIAPGHKGFAVTFDPEITPAQAAARRDFTINALMYDPRQGRILDFFNGRSDLDQRILRHTSLAFTDDPLRVLRGMQFIARFNLDPAPATVELCRTIQASHQELARERIRDEWFKWAAASTVPSKGLQFLVDTGWIEHYPEINALRGTPQEPDWHPEGDVFVHTCHCLDALVSLPAWQRADTESRIVYSLAVLAHDFAKPPTTHRALKDGVMRIVSPGHEEAGGPLAHQFLERINAPLSYRRRVIPLVINHLAHLNPVTDRSVRRLAKRLEPETIEGLAVVITADQYGRPPKPQVLSEKVVELVERAAALQVQQQAPKPILMGRHLLELGLPPGKLVGRLVAAAYEAQLEGDFNDLPGAFSWLRSHPELPASLRRGLP